MSSGSKFDFVKRSELTKVFESDAIFLESIMSYLEDKKYDETGDEEGKENCEYKIKRMPRNFSRAQRNKSQLSKGLWTVEFKDLKLKNNIIYVDDVPEAKNVWELASVVREGVGSLEKIVLLDVEGREWPVDASDTLGSVLRRKMCILEFPTFVIF